MSELSIAIGSRYNRLGKIAHQIKLLKEEGKRIQKEIMMLETEGRLIP